MDFTAHRSPGSADRSDRIAVRIDHCNDRDLQTVRLADRDLFVQNVNDKNSIGRLCHFANTTRSFSRRCVPCSDRRLLSSSEAAKTLFLHTLDILNLRMDFLTVSKFVKKPAHPTAVHIEHPGALSFLP